MTAWWTPTARAARERASLAQAILELVGGLVTLTRDQLYEAVREDWGAERAGQAALYRADGLLVDIARSVRSAKIALTETRKRVAELDAARDA